MNAYQTLEKLFNRLYQLDHLHAITSWDEAVMMPSGGGQARAQALGALHALSHELLINPQNGDLIERAKQQVLENPWQQANLKWIEKTYKQATCLPIDLVEALTEASIRCEQAWRVHRENNDWSAFKPLLEKTLNLVKESAQIRAHIFKRSPYDILIDQHSPDLCQAKIDPIFATLKQALPPLIEKILNKQTNKKIIVPEGPFDIALQKQLGLDLMRAIGFNFEHGRLDVSHHPFCGGVPEDVRITTRYNINEFITSAMGVCHETGHARYEQNLPRAWISQPVGHALGMAMHESQSLLIEMQACRSLEFMHFLAPLVEKYFGKRDAFTPDNLRQLYTRVKPNLIRVDADEVTYPLHVIIRYECEQALIEGDMHVADLPEAWDAKMQQYLGLSTKGNDKNGVMQDVHWPSGTFGYFPAYTLGSLIAAQCFAQAKQAHPKLLSNIKQGHFHPLFDWLNKHIHSQASLLDFDTLLIKATGEMLNPQYFLTHIQQRYLED